MNESHDWVAHPIFSICLGCQGHAKFKALYTDWREAFWKKNESSTGRLGNLMGHAAKQHSMHLSLWMMNLWQSSTEWFQWFWISHTTLHWAVGSMHMAPLASNPGRRRQPLQEVNRQKEKKKTKWSLLPVVPSLADQVGSQIRPHSPLCVPFYTSWEWWCILFGHSIESSPEELTCHTWKTPVRWENHLERQLAQASLVGNGFERFVPEPSSFGQRRVSHNGDVILPTVVHNFLLSKEGIQLNLVNRWKGTSCCFQPFQVGNIEVGHSNRSNETLVFQVEESNIGFNWSSFCARCVN